MRVSYKRLGDIATYVNGYAFKPKDWGTTGLPIIRIQNLTGSSNETNFYDGDIDEKYIVRNGDILISWSASLGIHEWKGENALLNQHIFKVVFDKEKINKNFFKFMVRMVLERIQNYLHGSTMKHITKKYFDNLLIPFPPLDIQEKIADTLILAESLVNKRKAQIEALDQLAQSVFLEMFGDPVNNPMNWKIFRFDDVFEIIDGDRGKHYPKQNEFYDEGYCLFLNTGNVTKNGFNFDKTQFITKEKDEVLRKGKLKRYDLVLTTRGTIGNIAYYDDNVPYDNIRINSGMVILRKKVNINPIFFSYYFRNPSIYKRLISGTAQPQMPISNLRKAKIYYPPLNLQNKFGDLAHNIEGQKNQMKKSLKALDDNFNSLLQRAFKGELFTEE